MFGTRATKSSGARVLVHNSAFLIQTWIAFSVAFVAMVQGEHSLCQNLKPSPVLTPFVDPLRIPETIDVSKGTQVTLGAFKITQKLHSELPPTTMYAYGTSQATATYPGPTLVATRYKPSFIRFENHIHDSEHFLRVDRSIMHWANPPSGRGIPVVSHLHGGEVPSDSDGHPDAWYTASGERGHAFITQNYTYPNFQNASFLWYHDHSVGITRLNVVAGLAGMYVIRSPSEEPPNLPCGEYEIPLFLQDKQFWANGSINFPDVGDSPGVHPNWCPEYFGDTILVNGVAWPFHDVYPAKYRFRLLNGANARFFILSLSDPSLEFIQIGTDGGFLSSPVNLGSYVTLPPAYRVDVIVDFSKVKVGTSVYLNNSGAAPFPSGDPSFSPPSTNSVMEFRVRAPPKGAKIEKSVIPKELGTKAAHPTWNASMGVHRTLTLIEVDDENGPLYSVLGNHTWVDPVTETPKLGSTEIWDIINLTPDAHPIHIHLISFLFLHQQSFNQTAHDANLCTLDLPYPHPGSCYTEKARGPDVTQIGWKDTVIVWPSNVTRLWMQWTPRHGGEFVFDATRAPGYVWHCHILDHEDNDMMRPLQVTF